MGNEIQIPYTDRKDSAEDARVADTGMPSEGNDDSERVCVERPCTYASVVSARPIAEQNSAIPERAVVEANTGRVSRVKEAILGTALVGEGVFLRDIGERDRRDDTGLHKPSQRAGQCQRLQG